MAAILLLTHDVDNLVAQIVFIWMLPALVIFMVSARSAKQAALPAGPAVVAMGTA
jgi:hypothetical protein